ncbi:NAD(P)-binding protein [Cucurbitaria berberidis CBS 394.84]|uniref:NAD(P)-binding protein n=1 Tax=Cucurbitaria berberidis CBS 394.84 TaxID=1168544 RepID=A0A9P4GL70_9PLEO|nr:NAD(P)-binding protein [Cucurbitaria berberidis CBS 394.84]KAF1847090.1 NAD(P)-binding protein [Cucurbitaria berberidis CBS 394.84]
MQGVTAFDPAKDIPDLTGKVILVTGGTAGLGATSVRAFAAQNPSHIYFTGRNVSAANALISEIKAKHPTAALTFIEMDLSSLQSVKQGVLTGFKHDHLEILINNAGIIAKPQGLSTDGYEIQFATNHLGHAMLTQQLLPYLLTATQTPGADVRVVTVSSDGYAAHRGIKGGISFTELDSGSTMSRTVLGPWVRYGQSKLANILFASELARRYPNITSVSIHPGVVETPMNTEMRGFNKKFVSITTWLGGIKWMKPEQGVLNQLWCAAGAKKEVLKNGGFYRPVGVDDWETLTKEARDGELAKKLLDWTESVLDNF